MVGPVKLPNGVKKLPIFKDTVASQIHSVILKLFKVLILITTPKFLFRNLNIIVKFNPNQLLFFQTS